MAVDPCLHDVVGPARNAPCANGIEPECRNVLHVHDVRVPVRMPTAIKVGPYTYTVDQDPTKLRQHEHLLKAGLSGGTAHETTEIHIDPTSSESYKRETLWHEVKHAVCNLFGWGDEKKEEEAIGMTSAMELAVLRDNPELVAYLTAP